MDILLIDDGWYNRFLEQLKKTTLSDEDIKKLNIELKSNSGFYEVESTAKDTAVINVLGPLSKTKDPFLSLFSRNNTSYDDIVSALDQAELDDGITDAKLKISSPGGEWTGLTEVVNKIAGFTKPIVAEVTGMATSAAYVIAAQADKIVSTTDGNDIGGLGVQVRNFKFGDEKITRSSNAPNKNPDVFTKEGEKEMVKQLDAVEAKAIKMVSEGRSAATGKAITEKVIKKDFGRGASMLADEALKLNMIDEITPAPPRVSNAVPGATSGKGRKLESESERGSDANQTQKGKKMEKTLAELMAEYPQLCAQLVEQGRAELRDQVKGHITMAKQTGAVEFALECLDGGKSLSSQEVVAGYLSAGMNKKDLQEREEDNPDGDLDPDKGTELSEKQKEDDLVEKALKLSNKPQTMEV